MPYVKRNAKGHIVAISAHPNESHPYFLDASDAEFLAYLATRSPEEVEDYKARFVRADLDFIRVMEDLIDTLIDKQVICFTDLPEAVQRKIVSRRKIRAEYSNNVYILDDDSPLI